MGELIIWLIVGVVGAYLVWEFTKWNYYQGMRAGFRICDGVWLGKNIGDLAKQYDRYKK